MKYREKVAADVAMNLVKKENKPKLLEIVKSAGIDLMPDKFLVSGLGGKTVRR